MTADKHKITLSSGYAIPVLGLGTWKSEPGLVGAAVKEAITVGYRHLDCAHIYENEKEIGVALEEVFAAGLVSREELFITSKLWNTFHSAHLVEPALRETLASLHLEYLDLYLIHWPTTWEEGAVLVPKDENGKVRYKAVDHMETWRAMEKCVQLGLVRSIGLSNFNSKQIQYILDSCSIKPVINQVECHPYLNQKKLKDFCADRGIALTAYSPLGSPNRPWAKPEDPILLEDPKLKEIATAHGKSSAQVLLRYQIERGVIAIPKSISKNRIVDNFDVFDFRLSTDEISTIDTMDCGGRLIGVEWMSDHSQYPFSIEF